MKYWKSTKSLSCDRDGDRDSALAVCDCIIYMLKWKSFALFIVRMCVQEHQIMESEESFQKMKKKRLNHEKKRGEQLERFDGLLRVLKVKKIL